MMRVLVTYGTTDGQTAKVAAFLAEELRAAGLEVDIVRASATSARAWRYDGVVVAASLHAGGYQRSVSRWARRNAAALGERPAAFIAVCLGVMEHTERAHADLAASVRRFTHRTGWTPQSVQFVAGALKYTRYGWLRRRIMQRIVAKAGGDTDMSRDYEYTDWAALRAFAREFAASLTPPRREPSRREPSVASPAPVTPAAPPREPAWAPRVMVGVL